MRMMNFIQSLIPNFEKDRVVEDMLLTRTELKDFTIPSYEVAHELLKTWKYKSPQVEPLAVQFKRMVKGNENMAIVIQNGFKPMLENLDHLEEQIKKTYSEDVAGIGMTYLKGNLLQLAECFAFVSKFARKLLVFIYTCETAEYAEGGTSIVESLSPAEMTWITENFVSFCTAFNIVTGNPQQMRKQISSIPDVVITEENSKTMGHTVGEDKIDPFQMKFIPVWLNPIYHIGMFVAEWQADRYKAAKEELKLLQLRHLNLKKMSADGKPDAGLQKEIHHYETRIQALNYKIAKMEKE